MNDPTNGPNPQHSPDHSLDPSLDHDHDHDDSLDSLLDPSLGPSADPSYNPTPEPMANSPLAPASMPEDVRMLVHLSPDVAEAISDMAAVINLSPSKYAQQVLHQHTCAPAHESTTLDANTLVPLLNNLLYVQLCTLYWAALHWCAGPPKRRLSDKGVNHYAELAADFARRMQSDYSSDSPITPNQSTNRNS